MKSKQSTMKSFNHGTIGGGGDMTRLRVEKGNDTLAKRSLRTCERLQQYQFEGMAKHLGGEPPNYRHGGAIVRETVWYYRPDLAKDWECWVKQVGPPNLSGR